MRVIIQLTETNPLRDFYKTYLQSSEIYLLRLFILFFYSYHLFLKGKKNFFILSDTKCKLLLCSLNPAYQYHYTNKVHYLAFSISGVHFFHPRILSSILKLTQLNFCRVGRQNQIGLPTRKGEVQMCNFFILLFKKKRW